MLKSSAFAVLFGLHAVTALAAQTAEPTAASESWPLIPRSVFFSHPERMRVRMSPDGRYYSWVAPLKGPNGQPRGLGIVQAPVGDRERAEIVLDDGNARLPEYFWTYTPGKMVFLRDVGGNENKQLYLLDVPTRTARGLTNDPTVLARFVGLSRKYPTKVIYSSNARTKSHFDVYILDVVSGESTLAYENREGFLYVGLDDDLRLRYAIKYGPEGQMQHFFRRDDQWYLNFEVPFESVGNTSLVAADWEKNLIYMVDSRGRDKAVLKSISLDSGSEVILAQSDRADVKGVITDEPGQSVLAALVEYERLEEIPLNNHFAAELQKIRALVPRADFQIMSRTRDDRKWLLYFTEDDRSGRYILWDRESARGELAYVMQPELDEMRFARMNPTVIQSRDGLKMVSYLSLPTNVSYDPQTLKPERPVPLILYVHGGPWVRDSWGFHPIHQWLANRGYAVLSVNYRGSRGFGAAFESASYGEWGRKMHDDLIDAVEWAVSRGIAPRDKIGIMGASYGGYATLVGLTFTPEVFAAGVNIVGISNLVTHQQAIPAYWRPFRNNSIRRMGADVETEEGRAFLRERSPLFRAQEIRRPLLIGHGDNDPRVKIEEALQLTDAMKALGLPVTLARFPDEGHGFLRSQNRNSFYALVEAFWAQHLGGRAEPIALIPGTTMNVTDGAEHIPGLPEALRTLSR